MNSFKALLIILITSVATPVFAQAPLVSSHASPRNSPVGDLGRVVMKVNGTPITERDVQETMQKLFPFYAVHGGKVPAAREPEIRQKALKQLEVEELVYQEAQRRKIAVPSLEIKKSLSKAIAGFRTNAEYKRWVQQRYGSEPKFKAQVRRAMMISKLWEVEVTKKSAVTEPELSAYYRKNKARFVRPESVALQTISVSVPHNATDEQRRQAKSRAEDLLAKARSANTYEEFGILAEKYSEDDWRVMMGDHKAVHRGSLAPELEGAAFQMQKGATSGLLQSSDKYVILRVNDKLPETQLSLAQVRGRIREQMQRERLAARTHAFETELRKGAKIEQLN